MPTINTPASAHAGPAATAGWQWLPYTDASLLAALRRAIHLIDIRIKGSKPCGTAFTQYALRMGEWTAAANSWANPTRF